MTRAQTAGNDLTVRRRTFVLGTGLGLIGATFGGAAFARPLVRRTSCGDPVLTADLLRCHARYGAGAPLTGLNPRSVVLRDLLDIGPGRIAAMEARSLYRQILAPADLGLMGLDRDVAVDLARSINDEIASKCARWPDRLVALAALPIQTPAKAAQELARARSLGLVGGVLGCTGALSLGDRSLLPVYEAAQALHMPLLIKSQPLGKAADALAGLAADWFRVDPADAIDALEAGGVLRRFPRLKLVVGHASDRLVHRILSGKPGARHPALTYSTSGLNYHPDLAAVSRALKPGQLIYGPDGYFLYDAARLETSMAKSFAGSADLFQDAPERVFRTI